MTDPASARQISAADPGHSVWLSANAGSGKTKVLTDRVARLLLGGTEPQKILCLTYTKAAASEMQNRLLKRLGEWAMFDDARLRAELIRLGSDDDVPPERLAQARRLFAKAIETPGGLKIQTIHSFCGMLLRRFPLEAGVPHGFAELDDRSASELRARIVEEIAEGPERAVLDRLADHYAGEDLTALIAEVTRHAPAFADPADRSQILAALGLPGGFSSADMASVAFDGSEKSLFDAVIPLFQAQSQTMKDVAARLKLIDPKAPTDVDLSDLQNLLLRKADWTANSKIPTKKALEAMGEDLADDFRAFTDRLSAAKNAAFALNTADRSEALARFARAFLPRYRSRKAQGGWLDFDDLIERAGALLSRGSVAQWVLFRLDGGIDHILVDEAQDTSPGQWQVIERLADEFTSGEGARDEPRTIFVVGDRKQSIYSFQGADLHRFEAMRDLFTGKFAAIGRPIETSELQHSFRSSPAILRLVDEAFSGPGSVGLGGAPSHIAFHEHLPGRVDLWPAIAPADDAPESDWEDPIDLPGREDASLRLAHAIAAEIRAMIAKGVQIPDGATTRPVHEGDFLILVQRRARLFNEIIRACKAVGLAVAGADRLRLGAEIAVKDILSLLTFLATPEDDLSLAEALRSPLFGWSESDLYQVAQPRKGYLWPALRARGTPQETIAIIQDLLGQTDFLRPFDLIERVLNRHGGRERLIARLGPEAEDGIDELIQQALAYESTEIPSLMGFLGWLGADDIEVKRQLENEGRTVRVMTVHGSKGLESPIVILPDTAKPGRPPRGSEVFRTESGVALWKGGPMPEALRLLSDAEASRTAEEKMRLLYVALTRAEKWLIVAAAGDTGEGEDSWYALIASAMGRIGTTEAHGLVPAVRDLGVLRRVSSGDWPAEAASFEAAHQAAPAPMPEWLFQRPPAPTRPDVALSPSDLGGAKVLLGEIRQDAGQDTGQDEETAKRYGRRLHLLLEHLPAVAPENWDETARTLLSTGPDRMDDPAPLATKARQVLTAIAKTGFDLAASLAEVEVTATLVELGGRRIHGAIDRLWVSNDTVHLLDYKSNAVVPERADDVPLGIVRQMAAYRAALGQIYPGRQILCTVVWTETATLTTLGDSAMQAALADIQWP